MACRAWIGNKFVDDTQQSREKRESIIWTDESWIQLFPEPNRQNERIRTQHAHNVPVKRTVKFVPKVLVPWAITAYGLPTIHFVSDNQTINREYYRKEI